MTAQTQTSPPAPTRMRASDTEREETVARLHRALGEGRLDLAENEARVAAAYAVHYRDELPPLLADLPDRDTDAWAQAPAWSDLWVAAVWRVHATLLGEVDRPTPGQSRTAAILVVLAALWTTVCAFLGAGLVA